MYLVSIGIFTLVLGGCSPSLKWITEESSTTPSCSPDRLLTWDDFIVEDRHTAAPAAQTAVRFLFHPTSPYLVAKFDSEFSWVQSRVMQSVHSNTEKLSAQLLAHEQVHYLISCLLVRQANMVLQPGDDRLAMLELVKAVAQRMNLQYDYDTNHGVNSFAQVRWESAVQEQLEDINR